MTNVNRAKTAVLAALALIVIVPATAAVISNDPGSGTVPAPAQLDGSVEIGPVEVVPGPSAAPVAGPATPAPAAPRARRAARPAPARAVSRTASCRTVELDQGGRPDHRTVLACD